MNTSWNNTREALKNFTNVLTCNKCGNKPIDTVKYSNCGHFFCKQCVQNVSICAVCRAPVQPLEIRSDHLTKSLVSYCDSIADIIQEKDLWNAAKISDTIHLYTVPSGRPKGSKTKYRIPKKKINKRNAKGETNLHIASIKNEEDYVKALLAAGADPNTKDHAGWTPLQEVVNYGHSNICQLLLESGAMPNTTGNGNRTALHDAVINNRLLEAQMLLEYSANKNVHDNHGHKPIDYCKPDSEMWNLLKSGNESSDTIEEATNLNITLNQSLSVSQSSHLFVIYASNLKPENKKYINQMTIKHKIKAVSVLRPSVTHIIVETNNENIAPLTYDVMIGLLRGSWLLNTQWIQFGMDIVEILKGSLELFEVCGTPIIGIPRKARENAQSQNPGLFNHCHFYFDLQAKNTYRINNIALTKDALADLVREGGGTVLKRQPDPEDIKDKEQFIPFHVANEPDHSLYKCTHFIIYAPGRDEPRVKYNMLHIKTLPLMWFIECIEKFTLIDPTQLGLLKF